MEIKNNELNMFHIITLLLFILFSFLGVLSVITSEFTTFEEQAKHFYEAKEKVEKCESIGGVAEISNGAYIFFDQCHIN